MTTALADLVMKIACTYCGAQPGEPCVTRIAACRAMPRASAIRHYGPSGRASYPHTARCALPGEPPCVTSPPGASS